ncbi:MAG: trypsin-like peptidase domain-containing protein [Planctomycetales bacterium]|nr:trypsin-like peptidase domain-containing protein [Planctomycetales bacterium]
MKRFGSFVLFALLSVLLACSEKSVNEDASSSEGKAIDPESAELQRLTAAAEAGDTQAQVQLAKRYLKWKSVTRNPDLAFKWYLAAAQAGNVEAMSGLIAMHAAGLGPKQPDDFGLTWVKRAAEAGSQKHISVYADWLSSGQMLMLMGVIAPLRPTGETDDERLRNGKELLRVLELPAFKDSPDALYYRGMARLFGLSTAGTNGRDASGSTLVAIDRSSGLNDLETAARLGSSRAQLTLGLIFDMGQADFKRDTGRALKYWDMLDTQKDAEVQWELGRFFHFAPQRRSQLMYRGMPLTEREGRPLSAKWYQRAADQGNRDAMLRFAEKTDDLQAAFQYRQRAAQEGSFEGMLEVGRALQLGQGTIQDFTQAKSWLLQATEDPDERRFGGFSFSARPEAQYLIGLAALGSLGAPADPVVAHAWMNLANAAGNERAASLVGKIAQQLTTHELNEAQTLAREWQPGKDIVRHQQLAGGSARQDQGSSAAGLTLAMTGTGAVINRSGNVLTSAHVVTGCKDVRITSPRTSAALLVADKANDLAVLSLEKWSGGHADLNASETVEQGEEIVVYGFPLGELLPSSGNITTGVISSLAGFANNAAMLQITAPVQPGNSGGPLLNRKAQIVGVVVSKADAVKIARVTGDIPQNVNFAVSLPTVKSFLNANHVMYSTSRGMLVREKSHADLASLAQTFVVKLECWK